MSDAMLITHQICVDCVPEPVEPVHPMSFSETGMCCWCGRETDVMLVGSSMTELPHCSGHDAPVWTVQDYARAVITEYRLGEALQTGSRFAPADLLEDTTLHQAINALEEALQ